jgi:hypothetical protein
MPGELGLISVAPQRGWEALKAVGWSIQNHVQKDRNRPRPKKRRRLKKLADAIADGGRSLILLASSCWCFLSLASFSECFCREMEADVTAQWNRRCVYFEKEILCGSLRSESKNHENIL